jgi:RNA polymerase sigma-70 factor (ECF subfamily)
MSAILKAYLESEKEIKRYLKRLTSNSSSVDDYAQEAFLKSFAAETRSTIKEPRAFLFKVARNVVFGEARHKKTSASGYIQDAEDLDQMLDDNQPSPEVWLDGRRKLLLFSTAVANLPEQCRKAFLLRRVEGLQYGQIADRMGISVSMVEKHVQRGLVKCNAYLREQGYDMSEFGATTKDAAKSSPLTKPKPLTKLAEQVESSDE